MIFKLLKPNTRNILKKARSMRGFTLIELMVSIALFTTVALIATTALTSIQKVNVRVQNVRVVMDNLALSLETISNEIRQGSTYHCYESDDIANSTFKFNIAKNCLAQSHQASYLNGLVFRINSDEEVAGSISPRVAYYLDSKSVNDNQIGVIKRCRNTNVYNITDDNFISFLKPNTSNTSSLTCENITSDDVNMTKLKFTVYGEGEAEKDNNGDGRQPYVLIEIAGETRTTPPQTFKLQTVVTGRSISY